MSDDWVYSNMFCLIFQHLECPLPSPLKVFEMIITPEQEYPLVCVGANRKPLKLDLLNMNSGNYSSLCRSHWMRCLTICLQSSVLRQSSSTLPLDRFHWGTHTIIIFSVLLSGILSKYPAHNSSLWDLQNLSMVSYSIRFLSSSFIFFLGDSVGPKVFLRI